MVPSCKADFSIALRSARTARGLSQEAFHPTSGRTYVSALERGLKQPTIGKVEELAGVLALHPLTLFALGYLHSKPLSEVSALLELVKGEVTAVLEAGQEG